MLELKITPANLDQLKALLGLDLAPFLGGVKVDAQAIKQSILAEAAVAVAPQPAKVPEPEAEDDWPEWLVANAWVKNVETGTLGVFLSYDDTGDVLTIKTDPSGTTETLPFSSVGKPTETEIVAKKAAIAAAKAATQAPATAPAPATPRRGPGRPRTTKADDPTLAAAASAATANPPAVATAGTPGTDKRSRARGKMEEYISAGGDNAALRVLVKRFSATGAISGVPEDKLDELIGELDKVITASMMQ